MADTFDNFLNKTVVGKAFKNRMDGVLNLPIGGSLGPAEANPYAPDPIPNFSKSNSSYSGTDCTVMVQLNNKLIVLGNLETFSHSIHREKSPVRVLGRSHPKSFTSGSRTIAGSMVFIVFDRAPLWGVIKEVNHVRNPSDRSTSPLPDQLPPLDLILLFCNEYGHTSIVRMYGVEFVDEGQVYSVNDLYSECTMSYMARDMDQMIAYQDIADFKDMMFERQLRGLFIDNRFQAMQEYQKKIEQEITDCNTKIDQIDIEINRRTIAGLTTLGISEGLFWLTSGLGKTYVSENDLNQAKRDQVKIKDYLLKELQSIITQITNYQNSVSGWNAQSTGKGNEQNDNLNVAPSKVLYNEYNK